MIWFGHAVSSGPARQYVDNGSDGQLVGNQLYVDLIVRPDPKPNINQATTQALIAPASVASICAVIELPRAGGRSWAIDAVTAGSVWAGRMTRI
jgi:hypothetical protein